MTGLGRCLSWMNEIKNGRDHNFKGIGLSMNNSEYGIQFGLYLTWWTWVNYFCPANWLQMSSVTWFWSEYSCWLPSPWPFGASVFQLFSELWYYNQMWFYRTSEPLWPLWPRTIGVSLDWGSGPVRGQLVQTRLQYYSSTWLCCCCLIMWSYF